MTGNSLSQNIVSFGRKSENLLVSIREETIGTTLSTAPNYISKGSKVFLHCRSLIWGSAEVCSDYFCDSRVIWKDKTYPHRFKIKNIRLTFKPISLIDGNYNLEFRKRFGPGWAYKFIFVPKPLPLDIADKLMNELKRCPEATSFEVSKILEDMSVRKRKNQTLS